MADRQRAALGQVADIGQLYDGRNDCFMSENMIHNDISPKALKSTKVSSQTMEVFVGHQLVEKLRLLGIENNLAASVLVGMTPASGHASWLNSRPQSTTVVEGVIYLQIRTENLEIIFCELDKSKFSMKSLLSKYQPTDVVAGIHYGAGIVLRAHVQSTGPQCEEQELEKNLQSLGRSLSKKLPFSERTIFPQAGQGMPGASFIEYFSNATFTIWSDIDGYRYIENIKLAQLYNTVTNLSNGLATTDYGRGIPLNYDMMSLRHLELFTGMDLHIQHPLKQPHSGAVSRLIDTFQEIRAVESDGDGFLRQFEYRGNTEDASSETPAHALAKVKQWMTSNARFRDTVKRTLHEIRASCRSPHVLDDSVKKYYASKIVPQLITSIIKDSRSRFEFQDHIRGHKGQYLNYRDAQKAISVGSNLYILWYTTPMMSDEYIWSKYKDTITNLLSRNPGDYIVAAAECQSKEFKSKYPKISFYRQGLVKTEDLLENFDTANQCFARSSLNALDATGCHRPQDKRLLQIPCPHNKCDRQLDLEWHCYRCRSLLEHHDDYLYCDCGRAPIGAFEWQCNGKSHGCDFKKYPQSTLKERLAKLEAYNETNILLLGETGVGKSTFINAFYNYMLFSTLDEALEQPKLEFLIPCSFTVQSTDGNPRTGRYLSYDVSVGSDSNEVDGSSGDSATQSTTVHKITLGDRKIRLIDTPGMGDVRGVEKDQENMENILRKISKIPKLDGIIILLKPNAARLNLMFRFCVQELLTSLHRDAARNIVWGFTNTRQSNYMPGDTLKPLQKLLESHKDLGLEAGLESTTYCFDSEGFRYLAAKKKTALTLPHFEDFQRSWIQSADETRRLIEHLSQSQPHQVRNTVSLNNAREAIAQLTRPLADIADSLQRTIEMNEAKIQDLEDVSCQGSQLRDKLHFEKVEIQAVQLDYPRTVCAHVDCIEYKDVGGIQRPLYKSTCHGRCSRTSTKRDTIGEHNLMGCWAMIDGQCRICSHHWQTHMHIWYQQVEETVKHVDPDVQIKMEANASDVALKQAAIQNLEKSIRESRQEQEQLRDSMCQFAVFLKKNAIRPYNDAMIDYIDHMIKEELEIVQDLRVRGLECANNENRLSNLKKNRVAYLERIKTLEENLAKTGNAELLEPEGVTQLIQKLYALPKFGANLQKLHDMIQCTEINDYYEQEHRPKSWWRTSFQTGCSFVSNMIFGRENAPSVQQSAYSGNGRSSATQQGTKRPHSMGGENGHGHDLRPRKKKSYFGGYIF